MGDEPDAGRQSVLWREEPDRYPSVLAELEERKGPPSEAIFEGWFETVLRSYDPQTLLDLRPPEQKRRLFGYKEQV